MILTSLNTHGRVDVVVWCWGYVRPKVETEFISYDKSQNPSILYDDTYVFLTHTWTRRHHAATYCCRWCFDHLGNK